MYCSQNSFTLGIERCQCITDNGVMYSLEKECDICDCEGEFVVTLTKIISVRTRDLECLSEEVELKGTNVSVKEFGPYTEIKITDTTTF